MTGIPFFHDEKEYETNQIPGSSTGRFSLLDTDNDDKNRPAIVRHGDNSKENVNNEDYSLVISCVLQKNEVSDLEVKLLGIGKMASRVCEKDGLSQEITGLWCEWLGKKESADSHHDDDGIMIPEHDFAIVTFAYNYDLGRKGLIEDVKYLLSSSPQSETSAKKKQRTLNSDGDEVLQARVIISKSVRKELRRQQKVAAEKMCDVCQHKMLRGKDVATLFNKKTGKLACSSRNVNGMLLCEMELCTKQSVVLPEVKCGSKRKCSGKSNKKGKNFSPRKQMNSVFCPECQGTGININGDDLEPPIVPLSEIYDFKMDISFARRAWMKCQVLDNCSTRLNSHSQSEQENIQGKVTPLKLLHFYRADE